MPATTTRRLAELRQQCASLGISHAPSAGREELMDLLRERLGSFDARLELDPMKARDLGPLIDWIAAEPFARIADLLTPAHAIEPKLDGCRLRLWLGTETNSINSGRRSVRTMAYTRRDDNFPHLRNATHPGLAGTVLDGELLAPSPRIQTHTGNWTDSLLNASVALANSSPQGAQETQRRHGPAAFHAFDLLALRGESATGWTYDERRRLLAGVVAALLQLHPGCSVRLVPQWPATADNVRRALAEGYEGAVIKRRDSTYVPGSHDAGWFKVKARSTADAYIVGYSPGTHGNAGLVGSLELAVRSPDGSDRPVAQVGNLPQGLRRRITSPDGTLVPEAYGIVLEFSAQGLTRTGRARSAHLVRIRPDKAPEDCGADQVETFARS